MGNHRADVTSDSPRSVTPSPEASTSTYVGKRRAAPADRPAARPASRATGTSYVGKRRAAPTSDVTQTVVDTPEEPLAKPRRSRVVLDSPTGAMPAVDGPPGPTSPPPPAPPAAPTARAPRDESRDRRISTGELQALVEGDSPAVPAPMTPAPARSTVPEPRRAPQIDPELAAVLSSMGIDPEKVTPQVLDDLGIGDMTTSELALFLTQPTKPAPSAHSAPSTPSRLPKPDEPVLGLGPAEFRPEPKISAGRRAAAPVAAAPVEPAAPIEPVEPAAPAALAAPEPTMQAPEPQTAPTPKPLRMADTFAPMTGRLPAVRRSQEAAPVTPVSTPIPAPAPTSMPTPPRGLRTGAAQEIAPVADPTPTSSRFRLDAAAFAPPTPLPYEIDVDSMSFDLPAEEVAPQVPYVGQPTGAYDFRDDLEQYDTSAAYFRADTGTGEAVDLPRLSEAATYSQEIALPDHSGSYFADFSSQELPAVETTGAMVGIGEPPRRSARRVATSTSHRPTMPMTAGAAAVLAAIGGVAMTGAPATSIAADDARLVGATALGGQSAVSSVGDRGATVTRSSERSTTDAAASTRAKALAGLDVKADQQDKFLKSNLWQLPIPIGQYHITGTFGSAGVHWATVHTGLDFAAPTGTPIHAIARGTVTEVGWGGAYGNRTIITLDDGTEIWYCHQSRYGASVGEKVSPGQIIGYVGATGNVTGPHVHVEVRPGGGDPVDPDPAMAAHGADPTP